MATKRKRKLYDLVEDAYPYDEESIERVRNWLNDNKTNVKRFKEAASYECGNETTLHRMIRNDSPFDVVETLIQYAAPEIVQNQDNKGRLPLHCACLFRSSFEIVAALVQAYPDGVRVTDHQGKLPIHYACEERAPLNVLDLLMEAYPESSDIKDGVCQYLPSDSLKKSIERPADTLRAVFGEGNFAPPICDDHMFLLHNAIRNKHSIHLVLLLLRAFPESCLVRDVRGRIPFHYACCDHRKEASVEIAMALLLASPNSCAVISEEHWGKRTQMMKFINEMASRKDKNKRHLLHCLAARGLAENSLMILLEAYPESISLQDIHGMLPFHHACLNPASSIELLMLFIKLNPPSLVKII